MQHISAEIKGDAVNTLIVQFIRVFKGNKELTHGEILTACLGVMTRVLASIQCPDCRAFAAKDVEYHVSQFIAAALQAAAVHDSERPQPSDHIH